MLFAKCVVQIIFSQNEEASSEIILKQNNESELSHDQILNKYYQPEICLES